MRLPTIPSSFILRTDSTSEWGSSSKVCENRTRGLSTDSINPARRRRLSRNGCSRRSVSPIHSRSKTNRMMLEVLRRSKAFCSALKSGWPFAPSTTASPSSKTVGMTPSASRNLGKSYSSSAG